MKFKTFFFLIYFLMLLSTNSMAQPNSQIYSSGTYTLSDVSKYHIFIKLYKTTSSIRVIIVDENNNEKISYKFYKNDTKSELNVLLDNNDTLIVIGNGEVIVNFIP